MKKLFTFFAVAITAAIVFSACGKGSSNNMPDEIKPIAKYKTDNIPEKSYLLEDADAVYPYGGKIYVSSYENHSLGCYDISNDMSYAVLADDISASIISVNNDELCAVCEDSVVVLNLTDGSRTEYSAELGKIDDIRYSAFYSDVTFDSDSIFIAAKDESAEDFTVRQYYAYAIDRASGNVDKKLISNEYDLSNIYSVSKKNNKNEYVLLCQYTGLSGFLTNGRFIYSNGVLTLDKTYGKDGSVFDFDPETEDSYGIINDWSVLKLIKFSDRDDSIQVVKNVDMEQYMNRINEIVYTDYAVFTKLFFTGKSYILWDSKNHLVNVCRIDTFDDTLTVLYPVNDESNPNSEVLERTVYDSIEYDMLAFEKDYNCKVQGITYNITEFSDRLRMKLLAGEDDFDIVYADRCDRGDILSAILRYQLYLPLENFTNVTDNLVNLADGVADFMTYDRHLIGSPYKFEGSALSVTKSYLDTGLPVPEPGWTLDDFYGLCEAAMPYCTDGTAFALMPEQWIMESVIQYGIDSGSIDRDEIRRHIEKIDKYTKAGVFATGREADTFLLKNCNIPPQGDVGYIIEEESRIVSVPLYHEKKYAKLNGFVFVNRNTRKIELAAEYISMLLSPEFVYKTELHKTYYAKDPESYFSLEWGSYIDLWGNNDYEINKWNKVDAKFDYMNGYLVTQTDKVFPETSMHTMDIIEFWTTVRGDFDKLKTSEITVDGLTDEIYEYVRYRYFE